MGRIVIAAMLLTAAATAQAATGAGTETIVPATDTAAASSETPARTADSDKPKRVCRARPATGSIMRGRVCRTASEDEQPAETTSDRPARNDGAAGADQTTSR